MDLLETAAVDISTLVATCHALKVTDSRGGPILRRKLRGRLRSEIKQGTLAYIDTLARTRHAAVDDALLAACRVAAEQEMPHAMVHQELLRSVMGTAAGSLDGVAASRQDLWRLAHLVIHLRAGVAALTRGAAAVDRRSARSLAGRLRRRLRKALVAYARAGLRGKVPEEPWIMSARKAALRRIGKRGAAEAGRLSALEAGANPVGSFVRLGVTKALSDLALDWHGG